LRRLFAAGEAAAADGEWPQAVQHLNQCISLLPPGSRQFQQVQQRLQRAAHFCNAQPPELDPAKLQSPDAAGFTREQLSEGHAEIRARFRRLGVPLLGDVAYLATLPLCATRVMFTGLTKPKTLISLAAWVVAFACLLGWKKALLFGFMIYVHEMGHLVAIQYYGFHFAWPFFVPLLGAFVLQGKQSREPCENAVIALAGPLAGMTLSFVVFGIAALRPLPDLLREVAFLNLLINFLNLLPFWVLDGARIARQLSRRQKAAVSGVLLAVAAGALNPYLLVSGIGFVLGSAAPPPGGKVEPRHAQRPRGTRCVVALLLALLIGSALLLKANDPELGTTPHTTQR